MSLGINPIMKVAPLIKKLKWVNISVSCIGLIFLLIGLFCLLMRPETIPISDKMAPKTALPARSFALPQEAYETIGEPLLHLQSTPLTQHLPDLKKHLIYYGKNGRPDAQQERPLLHFAFTGNKSVALTAPGDKLYISYDRKASPAQYIFSPNNVETSLWIEAEASGSEGIVRVFMRGEHGEMIQTPEAFAHLTLPEKEFVRAGGSGAVQWEIGKNKVDATLLARQRAKWYGTDAFLAKHGGKEYEEFAGKQRVDFGEGEDAYSVFVGLNDVLVWDQDRWHVVQPGKESLEKPLIVIKKIDDRLMAMDLWDPDGKNKITLNLIKTTDVAAPVSLLQQFKFVAARTRTQFVFEINKDRILLSPQDWLLSTKDGWAKLVTPTEIDDYVERRSVGPLLVFDEVERREDKQYLKGSLFNAGRTDMQPVEIPLQKNSGNPTIATQKKDPHKKQAPQLKNPVLFSPHHQATAHKRRPRDEVDDSEDEDDDDE